MKSQGQRVPAVGGVQVAFAGQQVQTEEAIVAPALPHFKVGSKLADNVLAGVPRSLVNHLHAVFVPGVKNRTAD